MSNNEREISNQVAHNWREQQLPDVDWEQYSGDKALLSNFTDHELDEFIADMRDSNMSPEGFATYETALIEKYWRDRG